jgi:CSLREA domain-containing protein
MKRNPQPVVARFIVALLLIFVLMFSQAPYPVQAASMTYTVTRIDDPVPSASPNICQPTDCSLREAIIAANANSGTDQIYLPPGIYTLTRSNPGGVHENLASTGDLDITDNLTINGAGFDPTTGSVVYANPADFGDRIFHVKPAAGKTKITVAFNNLRIRGGSTSAVQGGGGILIESAEVRLDRVYLTGNHASSVGGGVSNYSNSVLTITTSTFDTNTSGDGGGIYNIGTLNLYTSLLKGNSGETSGGGLDNSGKGIATVVNSTIALNQTSTASSNYGAGGISNSGTLTIKNVTLAENTGSGVLVELASATTILNSIFDQRNYPNCARKDATDITSLGFNLVYGSAALPTGQIGCNWNPNSDKTGSNANPLLGVLHYEESPTQTYSFTDLNSPAIDGIQLNDPNGCPATDQRMHSRWADGNEDGTPGCDIGAYEVGGTIEGLYLPIGFR